MKKVKIVLMVVVVFIGFVVITHGQGSKVDEGVVEQITKTGGDIKSEVGKVKKTEKRIRIEQEGEGENAKRYLRIYDEKGRVKKEIKLGQEIKQIKASDKNGKIREDAKFVENIFAGAVSDDGKKGMIVKSEQKVFEKKLKSKQSYEPLEYYEEVEKQILKIGIIDETGEIKVEKEIGENIMAGVGPRRDPTILDNGMMILLIGENEAMTRDRLYIYDALGNEKFSYPKDNNKIDVNEYVISPNGEYIGIRYSEETKHSIIFFNLVNGKSWDMGYSTYIYNITDEGNAFISKNMKKEAIDLKLKIGE